MPDENIPASPPAFIDAHVSEVIKASRDHGPHRVYDETNSRPTGVRNLEQWGQDLAAVLKVLYVNGPQAQPMAMKEIRSRAKLHVSMNHMVYLPYFGIIPPISYLVGLRERRLPDPVQFTISSYIVKASGDWRYWGISTLRAPDSPADDSLGLFYDPGMPPPPAPYGVGRYGTVTLCVVWAISKGPGSVTMDVPVDAFWWIPTSNFDPRAWCSDALRESPADVMEALRKQASLPRDVDVHYSANAMLRELLMRLRYAAGATGSENVFASHPWTGLKILTCDAATDVKSSFLPGPVYYGDDVRCLDVFRDAGFQVLARCQLLSPMRSPDPDARARDLYLDDQAYDRDTLSELAQAADDPIAAGAALWRPVGTRGAMVISTRGRFYVERGAFEATILAVVGYGSVAAWSTLSSLEDPQVLQRAVEAVRRDWARNDDSDLFAAGPTGSWQRICDAAVIPGVPNACARETRARWPILREQLYAMARHTGISSARPAARASTTARRRGGRTEKRLFERRPWSQPGYVTARNGDRLVGVTRNVSEGGMLLAGDGHVATRNRVRYALDLGDRTVSGDGEVVRCSADAGSKRLACAVRFDPPLDWLPASDPSRG